MDDEPEGQQRGDGQPGDVKSLMRQLKSQRLIKIFVGNSTEPFLMSETTLTEASPYFTKALKHESSLGGTESGVLAFPEDGDFEEAWELLLYWLMTRRLPPGFTFQDDNEFEPTAVELLIRTWVLADKYLLPELQDAVMLELLWWFTDYFLARVENSAEMANSMLHISPSGSPLRRLVAEEVISSIYHKASPKVFKAEHIESSSQALGVSGSLLTALHDFMQYKNDFVRNNGTEGQEGGKCKAWKEYLVDQGHPPMKHWVFDYMPGVY